MNTGETLAGKMGPVKAQALERISPVFTMVGTQVGGAGEQTGHRPQEIESGGKSSWPLGEEIGLMNQVPQPCVSRCRHL